MASAVAVAVTVTVAVRIAAATVVAKVVSTVAIVAAVAVNHTQGHNSCVVTLASYAQPMLCIIQGQINDFSTLKLYYNSSSLFPLNTPLAVIKASTALLYSGVPFSSTVNNSFSPSICVCFSSASAILAGSERSESNLPKFF